MSGGSWDFFYVQLSDVAQRLLASEDPLRRAFGDHLEKCSQALKDIEWCDSGDSGPEREQKSIKEILGEGHVPAVVAHAKAEADRILNQLQRALAILDPTGASKPPTSFAEFCAEHKLSPEECRQVAGHLAAIRSNHAHAMGETAAKKAAQTHHD